MDVVFAWMVEIDLNLVFGRIRRGFSIIIDSPAFCGWLKSTWFFSGIKRRVFFGGGKKLSFVWVVEIDMVFVCGSNMK